MNLRDALNRLHLFFCKSVYINEWGECKFLEEFPNRDVFNGESHFKSFLCPDQRNIFMADYDFTQS